jgi:hypothetical protein
MPMILERYINTGTGNLNITSNKGDVNILSANSTQTFHSQTNLNGGMFGSSSSSILDTHKEQNTSSNIISNNITINSNNNINIVASNLISKEDINLNTTEGSINIINAIDVDSYKLEETSSSLLSSSIDINGHNNSTIVSSNIISTDGNININSGTNILISASNLSGTNANLTAQQNITLISNDVFDLNKPLQPSIFHNYNKKDPVKTNDKEKIDSTIKTDKLTIKEKGKNKML